MALSALLLLLAAPAAALVAPPGWLDIGGQRVRFRGGAWRDTLPIATRLLKEKMNPLSVSAEAFIVCEDAQGERIGFGQIRKLADDRRADPEVLDARPGTADLEADADDDAWEDFEREAGELPWLVLPFSPEYERLRKRAELQRARRAARLAEASATSEPLWELASVFVEAEWRGRGVGGALIERLLERHEAEGRRVRDVYLITLEPTCPFYERVAGFERVALADVPQQMELEVKAGEALSFVLGNKLACMRGRR